MTRAAQYSLSKEEASAFEEDGVVCLRNILREEELERLRAAVGRQIAGLGTSETAYDFEEMARQAWDGTGAVEAGAATRFDLGGLRALLARDPAARPLREARPVSEKGMFLYEAAGWRRDEDIREVAFLSALPGIAGQLLVARQIQFWEDTTFVKAPGTRQKTAFHQDLGYFQMSGSDCVVAWVPLDPAGLWNGVPQYVRGSHKWGQAYAPNIFISQTPFPGAGGPRCPDIEACPEDYDLVVFEVEPGDVIVHHILTVHGAGGNPSGDWRRAMSFRYFSERARYADKPGAMPLIGVSSGHAPGACLNEQDFPVVWQSGQADAG